MTRHAIKRGLNCGDLTEFFMPAKSFRLFFINDLSHSFDHWVVINISLRTIQTYENRAQSCKM